MKKFKESELGHPKTFSIWKEEMGYAANLFLHPGQLSSRINS
jgi:hypothetical protein